MAKILLERVFCTFLVPVRILNPDKKRFYHWYRCSVASGNCDNRPNSINRLVTQSYVVCLVAVCSGE